MVNIWRATGQGRVPDSGMLHQIIFLVHDGLRAADKEDGIPVVQLADLIWGQQLPACHLLVGGKAAAAALGPSVGLVE